MKSKRDFCLVNVKLSLNNELDFFDGTANSPVDCLSLSSFCGVYIVPIVLVR